MDTRRVHFEPGLPMDDEMRGMPQSFEYRSGHDSTLSTSLNTTMFAHLTVPFDGTKTGIALVTGMERHIE
jgi:hypothetical protein